MAVREFDGVDDYINLDNGVLGQLRNGGAFSIFMLVYPLEDGSDTCFATAAASDRDIDCLVDYPTANELALAGFGYLGNTDVSWTGAAAWQLIGATRAGGAGGAINFHCKTLGSGTWTHVTSAGTGTTDASTCTVLRVGCFQDGTGFANFRLAVLAMFTSVLSDADFENIETNASTSWILNNLSPEVLVDFNQASTATAVTDLSGNGSDQVAINGTTVVTGSDPSWTFGAGGAVTGSSTFPITVTVGSAGVSIQTLNPSADSADGNWTTDSGGTALAAAIDEDSASDSDYIQSEFGPSNSGCRVKLESASDPTSSAGHIIRWRTGKNATGGATINMTVKLMQGGANVLGAGTQIASFNRNNVDSLTTYAETLSGGEADSITDYSDLYLEFYANQA